MCDTLCALSPAGTLFAKNSDRPPGEVQLIEAHPRRGPGGALRTQYLTLPDAGAAALLGARPAWLWGLEQGVNEHGVAIGNEKVYTTLDANAEPAALTGMDLVRLGLERGRSADEALEVMTALVAEHGQGGVADESTQEAYFSSFLIAGPDCAWVLETSGRTWAAAPVSGSRAISNRLTVRREWTRASGDVPPGADFDAWRHPDAPTGYADRRLAASRACLAGRGLTPADLAAHLRDHGEGPWGAPGSARTEVSPLPERFLPDGEGVTVCMHLRGFQNTTSSMIAELPRAPEAQLRAWVAPGSPCTSVYLPVFPPHAVPPALADPAVWRSFAALRDRAERDAGGLAGVRAVFGPLEADLWDEADAVAARPQRQAGFVAQAWERVQEALARLASAPSPPEPRSQG
ncbi:MAG: hypothetical protein Q7T33_01525 [Dehalococcoidia bacterium]|nr:hypothetical protein [Dehalococcoidia bacterium]